MLVISNNKPITGKENITDLSNLLEALAQFYFAFNNRDIDVMNKNWFESDEVSMDNPLGGIKLGWRKIKSVYEKIFNGPGKVSVEFYEIKVVKHCKR